jgi:pilus assembly protein Flp/PilA
MITRFINMLRNTRGASAAEYALILAIVGAAIAAAAIFLGTEVAEAINEAGSCISSDGATCN